MAETINMTNLNDLPSNPTMGGNIQNQMQSASDNLNKSSTMSLDETTISQIVNGLQQASLTGATRLPNRDIPMTSEHLTSDKQAMPNYVPTNLNDKYIDDDDDEYNLNLNSKSYNNLYSELQFPLLLGILYFIFQMPVFKNTLFQYFTFLFSSDGNYNINGLTFLSMMFSLTYYVFTNVIFKER
jgi:hypothetical protein